MNKEEASIWKDIDSAEMPKHIAIIMDGNGRWAKKRKMPRIFGHHAGAKTVDKIVALASEINLKALTLYSFSTENWNRPSAEVDALMGLLKDYLLKEMTRMVDNNIRFNTIGEIGSLPSAAVEHIEKVKEATKGNDGTILTLALSYGSQNEIVSAVRSIAERVKSGEINSADIDNKLFSSELDTSALPEVDMMIRTSGEVRVSNFLLWQIAYAELFFTDVLWPDFSGVDFLNAIKSFHQRERRFGKSGEQL